MANRDQHAQEQKGNGTIEHDDAVVIGAGVGGLYALHQLRLGGPLYFQRIAEVAAKGDEGFVLEKEHHAEAIAAL